MLSEWLRGLLTKTGTAQAVLGRALTEKLGRNIDRAAVNKMTKGVRKIAADELLAIAEFFGVPVPHPQTAPAQIVPLVSWVSAGAMRQDDIQDEIIGWVTVCELEDDDWIALRVEGDSMDRISPPDSVILVNRNDTRLVPNACYVISDGDGNATYKRYRPSPPRFEPVSTNPEHEPIFPENDPVVVGRVRMTLLKM